MIHFNPSAHVTHWGLSRCCRSFLQECSFSLCANNCACVCVCRPQNKQFTLEEDSIMSGRGRCPYDPNSPCTSTLSSKAPLTLSLATSPSAELKTQLWYCNECFFFFISAEWIHTMQVYTKDSRSLLTSQCCHLVVVFHVSISYRAKGGLHF